MRLIGKKNKENAKIIKNNKNIKNDSTKKEKNKENLLTNSKKIKKEKINSNNSLIENNLEKKILCDIHKNEKCNFLCTDLNCLKELCGYCILEHKNHFGFIKSIDEVFLNFYNIFKNDYIEKEENSKEIQLKNLNDIDETLNSLKSLINEKFSQLKYELANKNSIKIDNQKQIKLFLKYANKIIVSKKEENNFYSLDFIKKFLKTNINGNINKIYFEKKIMFERINEIIDNNSLIIENNFNLETSLNNVNKYLHWFEWSKRKLNLYNLVTNTYVKIQLVIPFKIPAYSRSIMLPDGKIYLLGGEISDNLIKKEVYYYDTNEKILGNELKLKTTMIKEKYDFTICYLNNFIYVISGKNSSNEITDTCERYNVVEDKWESIANCKFKRFASSAVVCSNLNKIFLIGGRNEVRDTILNNIEEYDVANNIWKEIKINNFHIWNPVEISASIQISFNEILMFGGSNCRVKDTKDCYIFNPITYSIEKMTNELKLAHVFVVSPYKYGNYIYAIGNEYYVKNRKIHRYNLKKKTWDIIF